MLVKTSELQGAALDWAVAKCEGVSASAFYDEIGSHWYAEDKGVLLDYSTDWAQGGPIIEREWDMLLNRLYLKNSRHGDLWHEYMLSSQAVLVVFLREYVASKLGDEVEVPEGIVQTD